MKINFEQTTIATNFSKAFLDEGLNYPENGVPATYAGIFTAVAVFLSSIKDKEIVKINISAYSSAFSQKIILCLKKRKYFCKKCKKTYSQSNKISSNRKLLSTAISWQIYNETKNLVSFSKIANDLKISEGAVRYIFNSLKTEGRKAMPITLCVDEKNLILI